MSVNLRREGARAAAPAMITGAQMLVEALRREQVEVVFGYPGGAVLPVYDALYQCGIRHVLTRHEQGAIHAAEGYARVSGRPGVVIATSGPGATNLVTGLTDAMMDSLPLVVFTGQVATSVIGTDAFQEASVLGITMPITKHNYQVRDVAELPGVIKEAFHIAATGRPGPVLIDLPKDIATAVGPFDYDQKVHIPGYQPTYVPNRLQIRKIAAALREAERPVILAGAGIIHARAAELLVAFAERLGIPVTNTLLGLGGFPGQHPLFLGMAGMHGTYAANMALYECDLLINIGARFDDRVTGNLAHFARQAKVVHIDIDPAEISKNIPAHLPIVGDAKIVLKDLVAEIKKGKTPHSDKTRWHELIASWKKKYPLHYHQDGAIRPEYVVETINKLTKDMDVIVTTGVGQNQMWAAQFYSANRPRSFISSGGLGTMGFGLPAAIGAQIGRPDAVVIDIDGDGSIQMVSQELATVAANKLPIIIAILNNGYLGMVRQWQELFYKKRYSQVDLNVGTPDFVKLAEAYGIKGVRVTDVGDVSKILKKAIKDRKPILIDFMVAREENVFPMVAPGASIDEMLGGIPGASLSQMIDEEEEEVGSEAHLISSSGK
ncbi:MAG: biosynthetic-type acetolactate synthase large subunit [Thermoflavifilum sp.]|nr:biosynthetic-type acetolactate synthase large subunit [Thermoflavifilum sp.]MCL6513581.1 biosynthetic-type acetolactate synthase large subunit [Alicyclobacillus sp.]